LDISNPNNVPCFKEIQGISQVIVPSFASIPRSTKGFKRYAGITAKRDEMEVKTRVPNISHLWPLT
jgi:hypothetical protein